MAVIIIIIMLLCPSLCILSGRFCLWWGYSTGQHLKTKNYLV